MSDSAGSTLLSHPRVRQFLLDSRWFAGKSKDIEHLSFIDRKKVYENEDGEQAFLSLVLIQFSDATYHTYFLPHVLLHAAKSPCEGAVEISKGYWFADGLQFEQFRQYLYEEAVYESMKLAGDNKNHRNATLPENYRESVLLSADQSNSAFEVNGKYFCKVFRQVRKGINTDAEVLLYFTRHTNFRKVPLYIAGFDIDVPNPWEELDGHALMSSRYLVMSVLQKVHNRGDAWQIFREFAGNFYREALNEKIELLSYPEIRETADRIIREKFGIGFFHKLEKLAAITAEMHLALQENPEALFGFCSESLQENKALLLDELDHACKKLQHLPLQNHDNRHEAKPTLDQEKLYLIQTRLKTIMQEAQSLSCIRIHGDYHLGQLLWTGDDFVVIDFEGEPGKSQELRRNKFPVHKDIAGMLRSFSYAALVALDSFNSEAPGIAKLLRPFANAWIRIVSDTFYERYLHVLRHSGLVYASDKDNNQLLDFFMMQKAIYEYDYEYHNRPQWTQIPVQGIQDLMEHLSS